MQSTSKYYIGILGRPAPIKTIDMFKKSAVTSDECHVVQPSATFTVGRRHRIELAADRSDDDEAVPALAGARMLGRVGDCRP